jgi:hypothetical protein
MESVMQGKALESKLLSTSNAVALLMRHYFTQGLREVHKVLGDTGPAVAQIPLTVVWTGGTVFDLTRDLAARRVGALSVVPRVGFITFTAIAQLLGMASKLEATLLAMLPYEQQGELSDARMVERYIVRPQNAVEAFGMAGRAFGQVRHSRTACACHRRSQDGDASPCCHCPSCGSSCVVHGLDAGPLRPAHTTSRFTV